MAMLAVILYPVSRNVMAAEPAEPYQMDEIAVTATLHPTSVHDLPVAVEVIGQDAISQSGSSNLSGVLSESPGLTLQPANGRLSVARLRGLDGKHTLVMLDGIRLDSGFQDYVDLSEIPSSMIDRVEVVRGAGSALYGSEAVGGVINVIVRKPQQEPQAGVSVRGGESGHGQAGLVRTDGWASGTSGKVGFAVSGTWSDRNAFDRDASDRMTDGDERRLAAGTAALTFALQPGLDIKAGFMYADTHLDGVRTQTSGDFNRSVEAKRALGYAGFDLSTGADSNLMFRASRTTYDWSSDMWPYAGGASTRTTMEQDSDQFNAQWSGRLSKGQRVTTGVEYRTATRSDGGRSYDTDNFGTFLQDELQLSDPFSIIAGVRYDHHSDFGSAVSPKLAAQYRFSEHFRLRGSYGEGFRAPTLYELYTGSTSTKKKILYANPQLDAEKSRSYEIGADVSLPKADFGVTAFRNDIHDMIHEVFTGYVRDGRSNIPVYQLQNISSAMTRGVEISASYRLPWGITLSDDFTIYDTRDDSTGAGLLYVPDESNVVRLAFASKEAGVNGNIRIVTTGKQTVEGNLRTDGYTLVNTYLSKSIGNGTDLFCGVDNVFDTDAGVAYGNVDGPGATGTYVYVGVNCRL